MAGRRRRGMMVVAVVVARKFSAPPTLSKESHDENSDPLRPPHRVRRAVLGAPRGVAGFRRLRAGRRHRGLAGEGRRFRRDGSRARSASQSSTVPGNHEFLGARSRTGCASERRRAAGTNVRLLDRDAAIIAGVRFVGAILWTDYRLQGNQPWTMAIAARGLNDHVRIERRGPQGALRFTPADALARHGADRDLYRDRPVRALRRPDRRRDASRAASGLGRARGSRTTTSRRPSSATCPRSSTATRRRCGFDGHTHDCFDYRVGGTRIVCNPKGYGPMRPGKRIENVAFDVGGWSRFDGARGSAQVIEFAGRLGMEALAVPVERTGRRCLAHGYMAHARSKTGKRRAMSKQN